MKTEKEILEEVKLKQSIPPRYCEACGSKQNPHRIEKKFNKYNGKLSVYVHFRCSEHKWWNTHFDTTEWFLDLDNLDTIEHLAGKKGLV